MVRRTAIYAGWNFALWKCCRYPPYVAVSSILPLAIERSFGSSATSSVQDLEFYHEPGLADPGLASRLPPGPLIRVKEAVIQVAKFSSASCSMKSMPAETLPEIALIGHSNVGKSTLINLLTEQPELARISKTPGCTKNINHFKINNRWFLVDCPGYGYAQVSKQRRMEWHAVIKEYFAQRRTLAHVLLLVDASLPPMQLDIDCALWLHEQHCTFSLVFTKADLQPPVDAPPQSANVATFAAAVEALTQQAPPYVVTSAATGAGRAILLKYLAQLRVKYKAPVIFK